MEENIEIAEVTEEIKVEAKREKPKKKPKRLTDAEIQSRYQEFLKRGGK